jgi:putative CocE/NonD family hydrolase
MFELTLLALARFAYDIISPTGLHGTMLLPKMLRNRWLAAAILMACGLIAPPILHAQPQAPFADVVRETDVMMKASDGTELATDVYRPAANHAQPLQRWPVLLHRTPYDKAEPATIAIALALARHGYVVVVQDMRGRHHSHGVFSKYYAIDAHDGFEAIEWAAQLPYANGKVGMYGTSYAAHTQADAAKLNPPHLATLVINMGGMSNAWDHSVRNDGAFELGRQLSWAWQQIIEDSKDPVTRARLQKERIEDWYTAMPLRKGQSPLASAPNYEDYYLDEAAHADDDAYWHSIGMNWQQYYAQTADVPMLHIGGWYDIYLRGTIENWRSLSKLKKSPERMLIGPWTHHGNTVSYAGDVDFGADAALADFDVDFHLRWFDHYLKGATTPAATQAPVRFFVMGTGDGRKDAHGRLNHGGYWRDSRQWPPDDTHAMTFYVHADGTLSSERPKQPEPGATTYTFDPHHPVPTVGGGVSRRLKDGAYDQRERADMPGSRVPYLPLAARADVLVFETAPLARDVTVMGPVKIHLFAASSGTDTDFTAKLIDVYPPSADYPDGFAMNLTDGIRRARYRDGRHQGRLIEPGKVYAFDIDPFDTANVFKKGHRIRLDISSSNFPRFDVNPNTGEPLGQNRRAVSVDNTVYHSARYPTALSLWVESSPPR